MLCCFSIFSEWKCCYFQMDCWISLVLTITLFWKFINFTIRENIPLSYLNGITETVHGPRTLDMGWGIVYRELSLGLGRGLPLSWLGSNLKKERKHEPQSAEILTQKSPKLELLDQAWVHCLILGSFEPDCNRYLLRKHAIILTKTVSLPRSFMNNICAMKQQVTMICLRFNTNKNCNLARSFIAIHTQVLGSRR